MYAGFGVEADLSSYPENYVFQTEEFQFEDSTKDMLSMEHYCHEPSFAPEGKSVVTVYFQANYEWWAEKYEDYNAYQDEKARSAEITIDRIEGRFPELAGKIKFLDLATPITYERYCGAYKGSYMVFGPTPGGEELIHDGKIEGLKNLYLAGQWLIPPGGLPVTVLTGKWAIQRICAK